MRKEKIVVEKSERTCKFFSKFTTCETDEEEKLRAAIKTLSWKSVEKS